MLQPLTEHSTISVEVKIFTVQAADIRNNWPWIVKFLEMIENPDWTFEHVFDELVSGRAQLWGTYSDEIEGIWVTRVENSSKCRFGLVWIAAGRGLDAGVPLFECTEQWFADRGCEYIEICGRPGWQKVLDGYKLHHVVLRKPLCPADQAPPLALQ